MSTNIDTNTIEHYNFQTNNIVVIRKEHINDLTEILRVKSSFQYIDADFDDCYRKIGSEVFDLLFNSNMKFLSLIDEQLDDDTFQYLLKKIDEDTTITYLEFQYLNETRLQQLLDIIMPKNSILDLVLYFEQGEINSEFRKMLDEYKKVRPFTKLKVINFSQS